MGIRRTYVDPDTETIFPDRRNAISDRRSPGKLLTARKRDSLETDGVEIPDQRVSPDRKFRAASAVNIAVVSTGRLVYGLIVDSFQDAEEIVVKSFGRHIRDQKGYAGATIMGDGRVSLILDIARLAEIAELSPGKEATPVMDAGRRPDDRPPGAIRLHPLECIGYSLGADR